MPPFPPNANAGGLSGGPPGVNRPPFPPGPPGDVLLGHALRVPEKYQWKTFAQWGKVYGNEFTFKEMQSRQVTGFQVICCTYITSEGQ